MLESAEHGGVVTVNRGRARSAVVSADHLAAATEDLIESLREYAADWTERLQYAPNHAENWGVVQLVTLSTDEQRGQWLRADQ